jgi:hypothetical protein
MEIKELLIGQWPDMKFRVGEINRIYGECKSIKSSWTLAKQRLEGGEWNESEYTATYDVKCIKDGVTRQISFNQDHPDIVVVMEK